MKIQSIVGSEVMSIDIELVSSVDVMRNRLLGSVFFFFFFFDSSKNKILVEPPPDLNNTVTSVIKSKISGKINHKDNINKVSQVYLPLMRVLINTVKWRSIFVMLCRATPAGCLSMLV